MPFSHNWENLWSNNGGFWRRAMWSLRCKHFAVTFWSCRSSRHDMSFFWTMSETGSLLPVVSLATSVDLFNCQTQSSLSGASMSFTVLLLFEWFLFSCDVTTTWTCPAQDRLPQSCCAGACVRNWRASSTSSLWILPAFPARCLATVTSRIWKLDLAKRQWVNNLRKLEG